MMERIHRNIALARGDLFPLGTGMRILRREVEVGEAWKNTWFSYIIYVLLYLSHDCVFASPGP